MAVRHRGNGTGAAGAAATSSAGAADGDHSWIALHIVESLYALLILAWIVLAFVGLPVACFDPLRIASDLAGVPAGLAGVPAGLAGVEPGHEVVAVLLTVLAVLVPLLCLVKLASPFLARVLPTFCDPTRFVSVVLNIVLTADVLGLVLAHMITRASSAGYFAAAPLAQYAIFLLSAAWNAASIVQLFGVLNRRSDDYRAYLEFRRSTEESRRGMALLSRQGIQARLALTYIPLIGVIIAILAFVLLSDYRRTVLASVMEAGSTLAERTATTAKANATDLIAMDDYLGYEAARNDARGTHLKFSSVTLYMRTKAGGATVAASTDRARVGTSAPVTETLDGPVARLDMRQAQWQFLAPVALSGKQLGWVTVEYARDVIYEPVFRTQVKVVLIASLFIYAAAFLTYLFGRAIVFPILFLRMSVNSIAQVLADMVKGRVRFSPELLQYRERVTTRDEIKGLSLEIGNMATVIRGVIPYISASTLRHSEREKPQTERRDLTFLFTDVRGFTTFCEGKSPAEVVDVLNRYLDLQNQVIVANQGEVDKYVGDSVMAMFEGPKKELHACRTAIGIRTAMFEERVRAQAEGAAVISIGIGINTGPVVFGSVGARDRMDFTSIGDTVNLAARLEGANKIYGTRTLLTEAVYVKVRDAMICREIDLLTVKGKREPVRIFELLQDKAKASEKHMELVRVFEDGLACYRRQKWGAAEKAFKFLSGKLHDEPSAAYLRRVAAFRKDPPGSDWDGVFEATVK